MCQIIHFYSFKLKDSDRADERKSKNLIGNDEFMII